jgi:hypothetical protein
MKSAARDILAAVFMLALVMILVRPNSYAPSFISEFGKAMDGLVSFAVSG